MSKRLKDIAITHISLVKEGANGKSVIYKSKDALEDYFRSVKIAKNDTEKGIVMALSIAQTRSTRKETQLVQRR